MKIRAWAALLTSVAMASTTAFAQETGSSGSSFGGSGSGGGGRSGASVTPHIKAKPKLTADQKKRIEEMQKARAEAQKAKAAAPPPAPVAAVISIDPAAGYDDSLICYQYHGVGMQIANAMKGQAQFSDSQKAQFDNVAKKSQYLQAKWFKHLGDVNGDKSVAEMNTDLQKVAGSVITDAQAGLDGNAEAQARDKATRDKCATFEKAEVAAAAPPG
jgi:hypothetical protein